MKNMDALFPCIICGIMAAALVAVGSAVWMFFVIIGIMTLVAMVEND